MSKYDALQEGFARAKANEDEYWNRLEKLLEKFRSGFCDYLGIDRDKKVNVGGALERLVVSIGRQGEDAFQPVEFSQLERTTSAVIFHLQLILDGAQSETPPNVITFKMSANIDKSGYNISKHSPGKFEDFLVPDFKKLFDQMYTLTEAALKRQP